MYKVCIAAIGLLVFLVFEVFLVWFVIFVLLSSDVVERVEFEHDLAHAFGEFFALFFDVG